MASPLAVGLVGLGAMGRPIALLLAASGVPTYCVDTDPAVVEAVAAHGVQPAASLPELGARCDVLLVLVPSDDDVLQVCSPDRGLLAGARPGTVVLVCSSVRPETCRQVAELAGPGGVEVLDAALTGGVRAAEAGTVNLLVGGEADGLDRVRPVLEPWTRTVHHLGPLGAGQVGKTVNNLCHWGQLSVIVEALSFGRELGVEPSALRDALMDGPAASRTLAEMQLMRLTWPAKDLANARAMAAPIGVALPLAAAAADAMSRTTVADIAALYAPHHQPASAWPAPPALPTERNR